MTQPARTPNPATSTRPERSSRRVARKKPLAWFPLALLGGLALLLALVFTGINAIDDDGPDGPAGDSLGQVGGSGGSGVNGQNDDSAAQPGVAQPGVAQPSAPQPSTGTGGLAGLAAGALVGGGGVPAAADGATGTVLTGARQTGTAGTVLFTEASAELDSEGQKVVAQAASALGDAGARSVQVIGYTDQVAGDAVNDPLSQQRADAVAAALRAALPGVSVTTAAQGAESPVASNDTEQGRQQNRRAAIVAQS